MKFDLGRRSIVKWAEGEGGADLLPDAPKFHVELLIGRGGVGEVYLVHDRDLKRPVAMKVLRRDSETDRRQRLHFIAEAQATSQLEHPGIPPIHDLGVTPGGEIYFTMKLVSGSTLRRVLHDLALGRPERQREYTLHKLVTVLERICETMQFAHERHVLHRDLKPENIMLGDYGEVQVMDWGLAQLEGGEGSGRGMLTVRQEAGLDTPAGSMTGTVAYMSPEQMRGDVLDRRSDVYALGCVLYEMLTLRPAFDARDRDLLSKKQRGDCPAVAAYGDRAPVPVPLVAICEQAMALDRETRQRSAAELGGQLRRWLDGRAERDRHHEEAELLAKKGRVAAADYLRLRQERDDAGRAAESEANRFKPWQRVAEKRRLLDARATAANARTRVALAFGEATDLLNAALTQEPGNAAARRALADLWRTRLDEADRLRDATGSAYAREMVRRFDDGSLAAYVDGGAELRLVSDPAGADVTLYRYTERDGVLVAGEERPLGTTPLAPVTLPMGSYLCLLRKAGFRETRVPVQIARNRSWTGSVRLRTAEEIGAGFVYVPGGPFVYGEGSDTGVVELADFAIAKYPVTRREYAQFLAALEPGEADARMPRNESDGLFFKRTRKGRFQPINRISGRAREWSLATYGEDFVGRLPVHCVSWDDARAYCAWKSAETSREWRLPTEQEREKAARGVDGRTFPWGDLEDASLAKCRDSREVNPQPEPVGAFETAESVYGMGDAAGGVWDWTDSWFDEERVLRALRGGAWFNPPRVLRTTYRYWNQPTVRDTDVGFRCARSLPPARA